MEIGGERTEFERLILEKTRIGWVDEATEARRMHSVFIRMHAQLDRCNIFGLVLREDNLSRWQFKECQGFILIEGELKKIDASGVRNFGQLRCEGTADGKAFRLWMCEGKLVFLFLPRGLETRIHEALGDETLQAHLRGFAIGNQTIEQLEPILDHRFVENKKN
jgi:hypothetical protein